MNIHFPLFKRWDKHALEQAPEREFTAFTKLTIYKPSTIATDISYSLTMFPTIAIITTAMAGSILSLSGLESYYSSIVELKSMQDMQKISRCQEV